MEQSTRNKATLLDLPLEMLTCVCRQLDLHDQLRVAKTCKCFRYGDNGRETVNLPTKSPVITALCEHAFPRLELIRSTRPRESWVAYLACCARQRRCQEAPIAAGVLHSLFVDEAGRLLSCGQGATAGHDDADGIYLDPTRVAAMARVRVQSVAAGDHHSLALAWDGRVYSWGFNMLGQLGHADRLFDRPS